MQRGGNRLPVHRRSRAADRQGCPQDGRGDRPALCRNNPGSLPGYGTSKLKGVARMAKAKVMDSARELEARAKQLFERIKGMNADMSATLEDMRQYEGKLIEKEKIAEKERAEALRIERLRELANSADTAAYHSDEPETAEPEKPKAEEKSEASAIKSAEPEKASAEPKAEEKSEPAEQKAESAKETAKPEQTKEELKK